MLAQYVAVFVSLILFVLAPSVVFSGAYFLLFAIIFTVGISHGALDHIIYTSVNEHSYSLRDQYPFYLFYFFLMGIYSLVWFLEPMLAFILFLAITVYHFGQADILNSFSPTFFSRLLFCSRGILIISLLLFNPLSDRLFPIILAVTGEPFSASVWSHHVLILTGAIVQYVILTIGFYVYHQWPFRTFWVQFVPELCAVTLLFCITPPIWAFAIYFGFWHCRTHINRMIAFLKWNTLARSWVHFYKKAWPLTVLSLIGIVLVYFILRPGSLNLAKWLVAFTSILTLPHMLIVEEMYQKIYPPTIESPSK